MNLEVNDLHTGYGRTEVVHGVSLNVDRGEVVAILGHNGAGKSTFMKAITGLLPCMKGSVRYDGQDITKLPAYARVRRGIGYVPQGQRSFGTLSAAENLQLIIDGHTSRKALLDETLDLFPALGEVLHRPAGLLSGGQRQQLAIARALLTEPKTLILDEPADGIQPNVVAEIHRIIGQLAARGDLGVLLVDQHVGFALASAQRYYILASGNVVASGTGGEDAESVIREAMAV